MSARLNPEKKDHPIEGTTEDEHEMFESLDRTRMYTLEAFKSESKVNPNSLIVFCPLSVVSTYIFREKLGTRLLGLMVAESSLISSMS